MNLSNCYSKNAIKVSDSHSSRPSYKSSPSLQNSVTCIYRIQNHFLLTLTWSNHLTPGFSIDISDYDYDYDYAVSKSSKKDRIPLLKEKGMESFESSTNLKVSVFWDLGQAKYGFGPEPVSEFYIVVVVNSELTVILGDRAEELEEIKKWTVLSEFSLISRSVYFCGNGSVYSVSKAKFCESGNCHDILVKCNWEGEDHKNPILSVYVDKKNVVQVRRLKWNFRGNQTIFLDDGLMVDLLWDVHDWVFNPTLGCGVFLFRTRNRLDNRLWLDKNHEQENCGFSLFIYACL